MSSYIILVAGIMLVAIAVMPPKYYQPRIEAGEKMLAESSCHKTLGNYTRVLGKLRLLIALAAIFSFGVSRAQESSAIQITTQPQSHSAAPGSDTTFFVAVSKGQPSLPEVESGHLRLWLDAGFGVVANSKGLVSIWKDRSENGHDASQTDPNDQPVFVPSISALGGHPAVRFNGIQDNVNGSYLTGAGSMNIPNGFTTFIIYDIFDSRNEENVMWLIGQPGIIYGASRSDKVDHRMMHFSSWAFDYRTDFEVPTNTYRLRMDWTDRSVRTIHMTEMTAEDTNEAAKTLSGLMKPEAGVFIGGLDPNMLHVGNSRCFYGDIAEFLCYSGSLNEADRGAIIGYLQDKYFLSTNSQSIQYQWQWNNHELNGATNSSLALTHLSATNSGTYSVAIKFQNQKLLSASALLTVTPP